MKQFLAAMFLFAALSLCSAITVDEVIQLSKLKTSDDLIIQTIRKSKLDKPVSPADVVRMKQEGVSEPVIKALVELNDSPSNTQDAYKIYEKTGKNGKKVKVATNVDEFGHRMGGAPPEPAKSFELPDEPTEINITINHGDTKARQSEEEADSESKSQQGIVPMGIPLPSYPNYLPYITPFLPNSFPHPNFFPNRIPQSTSPDHSAPGHPSYHPRSDGGRSAQEPRSQSHAASQGTRGGGSIRRH